MKLEQWDNSTLQRKRNAIRYYGKGLNYKEIIESLDYFDAIIEYIIEIKPRFNRFGMKAIAEFLRWHTHKTDNSVQFKVNNNLTADINHLLVRMFPELDGWLSVRYKTKTK